MQLGRLYHARFWKLSTRERERRSCDCCAYACVTLPIRIQSIRSYFLLGNWNLCLLQSTAETHTHARCAVHLAMYIDVFNTTYVIWQHIHVGWTGGLEIFFFFFYSSLPIFLYTYKYARNSFCNAFALSLPYSAIHIVNK